MKTGAFGIDIGGTTVKIGYFDTAGKILDKWEIPTRKEESGKWILPDIRDAVLGYLKEHGIPLYLTEGANHSLETGDVLRDIATLARTMETIDSFIESANA